jgi:hypothetical protein
MSKFLTVIFSLLMSIVIIGTSPATAENLWNNLLKQPQLEITVSLGNTANELN